MDGGVAGALMVLSQRLTLQKPMMEESKRNHPRVINRKDSQSLDVEDIISFWLAFAGTADPSPDDVGGGGPPQPLPLLASDSV